MTNNNHNKLWHSHNFYLDVFQPSRNYWCESRPWSADTQTTDDALIITLNMTNNVYDKINAGFPIVRWRSTPLMVLALLRYKVQFSKVKYQCI